MRLPMNAPVFLSPVAIGCCFENLLALLLLCPCCYGCMLLCYCCACLLLWRLLYRPGGCGRRQAASVGDPRQAVATVAVSGPTLRTGRGNRRAAGTSDVRCGLSGLAHDTHHGAQNVFSNPSRTFSSGPRGGLLHNHIYHVACRLWAIDGELLAEWLQVSARPARME